MEDVCDNVVSVPRSSIVGCRRHGVGVGCFGFPSRRSPARGAARMQKIWNGMYGTKRLGDTNALQGPGIPTQEVSLR
jgi:hypothetical protein